MNIRWLTQGAFLFELPDAGGARILVDPYMSDCLESKGFKRLVPFPVKLEELRPDMLVCTHDHLDHLDPETVAAIAGHYPACRLAGGAGCLKHFAKLGIAEQRCVLLQAGSRMSVADGLDIMPVPAFHSDPHALGLVFCAPRAGEGKKCKQQKIYLTGDTEYDERLVNEHTIGCDVLLVCVNGRLGNMNADQALTLAKRLRPAAALPMHFGLFAENTANPQPFVKGCKEAGITSWVMEPGKAYKVEGE